MAMKKKPAKSFDEMTDAELIALAGDASDLERDIPLSETKPLTAADRRLWEKAKARGRPKVGAGAKNVTISIETSRLAKLDASVKAFKTSRSALIAYALDKVLLGGAGKIRLGGKPKSPRKPKPKVTKNG
jgi:hypothetical protein